MRFCQKENTFLLNTENALLYKGKIWFTEYGCNELYCYDLSTEKTMFICKFAEEKENQRRLFGSIVANGNQLYLAPFSANKLYQINLDTYGIKGVEIAKPAHNIYAQYLDEAKFISAHAYNDYIYLIGATYPGIVEYSCKTGEVVYYRDWVKSILNYSSYVDNAFFRKTILVGSKIYAPSCKGNVVLEFDVETKDYHFYEVGSDKCYFSSICQAGEDFWLSPRGSGPIVKWNVLTNQWREYGEYPVKYTPCEFSYADIAYFNGYIYCIPMNADMLLRIGEKGELLEECTLENMETTHLNFCLGNQRLYLFSQVTGRFVILDTEGNYVTKELIMPEEQKNYHQKHSSRLYQIFSGNELRAEGEILYESYQDAQRDFILYASKKEDQQKSSGKEITKGNEIYRLTVSN